MNHLIRNHLLAAALWLPCNIQAQEKIQLDANWKFHLGHAANPEKDFNYSQTALFAKSGAAVGTAIDPRFNDSSWSTISLPHDWAVQLPFVNHPSFDVQSHGYKPVGGFFPETSIGWYRKKFNVTPADSGKRFQIQFDGIFRNASVWLNGFYLGTNESGYIGISWDITNYINFQKANVLVVRVDATQYEGWFYEGAGIYRHVWLNQHPEVHIPENGLYVRSESSEEQATVYTETLLKNTSPNSINCIAYTNLLNREAQLIKSGSKKTILLKPGQEITVTNAIPLRSPHRWNLNDPYLYRIQAVVESNGQVLHQRTVRFGIRSVRFDPTRGFFLNEQPLKIQGTNNHQDHAGVGSALPDYLHFYRIRLLKNMGANAYRCSHHAPAPELLDACDSLGMLVLDEQRLLNSSPEYISQFERLILRDRNHPSVFLWSIGNEEGWIQTNSFGKRIASTFIQLQQKLDPSRTCTYAADVPNVFNGINEVIPVRGFNYRHSAVADYHRDHPTQPVIGTEMGSTVTTRGEIKTDSSRCYLPDQDITAPWWASTAEAWWKPAAENPYWQGGFIWTGFDYRGEPTPFQWPNINSHFGVMDVCGFPKNLYYYYQSWWTQKDVLHISPHWNHPVKWGEPAPLIDVWVNSNADSVELLLNNRSLGRKIMPRNGHLQWAVTYEPGKLEAVGFKNGRQWRSSRETSGAPAEIVFTPYKTTLVADGQDVAVCNISIIDWEGREVPDANTKIRFTISGPGRIIGTGNGDPSSHEPDQCADGQWERSVFNGYAQLLVQSTGEPGLIKIEATSPGLWSGGTEIMTTHPASAQTVTAPAKYLPAPLPHNSTELEPVLGADISFLPELEQQGMKFSEAGQQEDAILLLKKHGFNYIRLRIFNNPSTEKGYSPNQGFCDLNHTLQMARRIKTAGLKLLLDFHYSDYWADPGKQFKPAAWENQSFNATEDSLYQFTRRVMQAMAEQNTLPDMVQVGNEINHGMVWPEGSISHPDSLARLIRAGSAAVREISPTTRLLLHVALGGQQDEAVSFFDGMLKRQVPFDIIGLSYYPKWHGTLDDLSDNMHDLIQRYHKELIVVEYSARKEEVNRRVFSLPDHKGKGSFIWEPLNTWEKLFDEHGQANDWLKLYDQLSSKYLYKK